MTCSAQQYNFITSFSMIKFRSALSNYRLLNGMMCLFKHEGESSKKILHKVQSNLCRDMNSLLCYDLENNDNDVATNSFPPCTSVLGDGDVNMGSLQVSNKDDRVISRDMIADNKNVAESDEYFKLIFGDRYIPSDFKVSYVDGLSRDSSGVLLFGIGKRGKENLEFMADSKLLRVYHVKGRFGYCTDDFTPKGNFLEKASFRHITQSKFDKLCASTQAAFSREMYRYSSVSPDSQEAYELAASGIVRPAERNTPPIIYSIKCIHFDVPDFTLEIHTINERCFFLRKLMHDLAIQLKSRAVCTGIRRLRYGHFSTDRALVRSEWNLENILSNIQTNDSFLTACL